MFSGTKDKDDVMVPHDQRRGNRDDVNYRAFFNYPNRGTDGNLGVWFFLSSLWTRKVRSQVGPHRERFQKILHIWAGSFARIGRVVPPLVGDLPDYEVTNLLVNHPQCVDRGLTLR